MQRHKRSIAANGASGAAPNWPTLLDRMLEDVGHIAQLNFKLMEAKLARSLMAMADRVISGMAVLYLSVVGISCLLVALILLLHTWLILWLCLAIGGVAIIVCALAINIEMRRPSQTPETGVSKHRLASHLSSAGAPKAENND